MKIPILYEDKQILAINKPYGLLTHTDGEKKGAVEWAAEQTGQSLYVVHRLDRSTTGVLVFAKTKEAATALLRTFQEKNLTKLYFFISASPKVLRKNFSIKKSLKHKGRTQNAETHFAFVGFVGPYSIWKAQPLTGRTHQIRKHAQFAGLSILGDHEYGGIPASQIFLHHAEIQLPQGLKIQSQLPDYFESLEKLKKLLLSPTQPKSKIIKPHGIGKRYGSSKGRK